jgi:ligand-binding SRPBCC domain-containing protein
MQSDTDQAADLASMSFSEERAVAGKKTGLIGLGESVTWEARHFGRRWTIRSSIVEYERPYRFVDIGVGGPFTRFRHEHLYEDLESDTLMTDVLSFKLRASYLGRLSDPLIGRPYLLRLLRIRNRFIKTIAENDSVRHQPGAS